MGEPIHWQGYDAHYQKLDKCPANGFAIPATWFVYSSGPTHMDGACEFYLENMLEGDEATPLNGRILIMIKELAKREEEE